ncbi:hypothetical protein KBC03_07355 [Patescibacteria group bacterium]|nr:hypothetical protein [Patescibacteria group bacterium]
MTTLQARTYTGKEDPYGIRTSLEKFLKQRNIKALMEVLHDEYPIGTHGSTTKSLMLSSHVKSHPAVQKELADVLLNFDFSNLKTNKNVSAMLSFVYFAV